MRVYVEMLIHADDENNSPSWKKFFAACPDVGSVEWCGGDGGATDVVVYFKDSEEPFPYSSLIATSCVRTALDEQINWAPE